MCLVNRWSPRQRKLMSPRIPGFDGSTQDRNGRHPIPILQLVGTITLVSSIVAATLIYLDEADERKKARQDATRAKHYLAWALINAARGASREVGLRYALQDLNADRVSLAATPLSKAHLSDVELPGADLSRADLSAADVSMGHLAGANLSRADLTRADLSQVYLSGADLSEANLSKASLFGANLSRANLSGA